MAVADTVVSAAEPRLEVAKDAMDVRQELRGSLRSALRARAMAVAQICERGIGGPAIRQDRGAGGGGAFDETRQRAPRGIGHDLESHTAGGLAPHFHRAHDQRLFQQLTIVSGAGPNRTCAPAGGWLRYLDERAARATPRFARNQAPGATAWPN